LLGETMEDRLLGTGRLFASHYQIVVCDDPSATISEDANWSNEKSSRGFAGTHDRAEFSRSGRLEI